MPSKRRIRWVALPLGGAMATLLAGCTSTQLHGFLPGFADADAPPATNHTDLVESLWFNSWVVLLIVGLITWGLMLWAMVAYRRRKGQTGLPVQLRYNMPIEIFYTVLPVILVAGMFAFTVKTQDVIEARDDNPDVSVVAIGKQWAWDFQYNGEAADNSDAVWTMGVQAEPDKNGNVDQDKLPTLYLPVGESVRIDLESRDVIHSFWVIDFLYKKDLYIGKDNSWSFTPTREGTYQGKCSELCGEYHSAMLFRVKVVSPEEYQAHLQKLRDEGNVGDITDAYDRLGNEPGTGAQNEGDN